MTPHALPQRPPPPDPLPEDGTCGVVCPVHLEPCAVIDPPDGGGAGALLGLKEPTLDEHRAMRGHLCTATDKVHTWREDE